MPLYRVGLTAVQDLIDVAVADLEGGAPPDGDTLNELVGKIDAETTRAEAAEADLATALLPRARFVDSVAAAVALPAGMVDGQAVRTTGFYAAGDGGGRLFLWNSTSTAAHDGHTVLQLTAVSGAGRLIAVIEGGEVDIRQFGADGTATNDNAAVTAANTAMAAIGGTVVFPARSGGWANTSTTPPDGVTWRFGSMVNAAKLGGAASVNYQRAKAGVVVGSHPTTRTSLEALVGHVDGSGANGIQYGDVGHEIRLDKNNWSNPAVAQVGEIDGQFIYLRQGGPTTGIKSAAGGQVIDVGMTQGTGFLCHYEHVSTVFDAGAGLAITYQIDIQGGVLNSRDGDYYGWVANANVGTMGAALYTKNVTGVGRWSRILQNQLDGILNFWIEDDGTVNWSPAGSVGTKVRLTNIGGVWSLLDGSDNTLFSVGQDGKVTLRSSQGAVYLRAINTIAGSPNGVVSGSAADISIRTDATNGKGLYQKLSASGNADWVSLANIQNFTTATRPTGLNSTTDRGYPIFDTTIGAMRFWNGTTWVDDQGRLDLVTSVTAAGTTQGTATALTFNDVTVSTVPAGSGVVLASSGLAIGTPITVWNTAAETLNVYPPSGATLNGFAADKPVPVAAGASETFTPITSTTWRTTAGTHDVLLVSDSTVYTTPADATEHTAKTHKLPALRENSLLRIRAFGSYSASSANTKQVRLKINGTSIFVPAAQTTTTIWELDVVVRNKASTAINQTSGRMDRGSDALQTINSNSTTIATDTPQDLTLTLQPSSTETMSVEHFMVELLKL